MQDVLLWTDSKIELFFLQIQGSGIGLLEKKKKIKINYGGNNKKKYSSIGKLLKEKKLINGEINLFTIKNFSTKTQGLLMRSLIIIKDIFFLILTRKTLKKAQLVQ